jgi:hypothetical protein
VFNPEDGAHLDHGNFLHLTVIDRTEVQARAWLEGFNHKSGSVEELSAQGNNRVIRITAGQISVSGKGGFDDPENPGNPIPVFQTLLDEFNADYPQSDATYNAHTQSTYDFNIKAPIAARDEIIYRCEDAVRSIKTYQRRWNMPLASRQIMESNGGTWSATASQIMQGGHLVDRLAI